MDLSLNVNGNSSGAQAALAGAGGAVSDLGDEVGASVVKWQELAAITKKAIETVVKFGIDSVKAFAESERVQKQLVRVAGEHADKLSEQAEAMSKLLAIDDDVIKQSQMLMVQWGGVGAASEKTTKAILDYAAATGQDAASATQDLIRNVESGGVGLAKLGVHFKATGDKGKDLAAAVEALNGKFGGAAAADASSLHGSIEKVSLAFEDLKKDIGGSIAEMIQQTGVAGTLTEALRNLREFMGGSEREKMFAEARRMGEWVQAQTELVNAENALKDAKADPNVGITILEAFQDDVTRAQAKVDALKASTQALVVPGVTGQTNKGIKGDAADLAAAEAHVEKMKAIGEKNSEQLRAAMKRDQEVDDEAAAQQVGSYADQLKAEADFVHERIKTAKDTADELAKIRVDEEKKAAAAAEKTHDASLKKQEEASKESMERMKKEQERSRQAADQIGAAFVNALADQLSKLAEGGEFDAALFVSEILASVVGIAGGIIGTALGAPAVGAAIGNLAAMGIRAGGSAISKANHRGNTVRKYHSGGWVGDEAELPRYHSGAWIGPDEQVAVLKHGERVLSPSEVGAMGGRHGVDAAARGRSGPTIVNHIQAIDTKSAAESFTDGLGRGMRLALKSGRGDLPALLGAGPR